MSGHSKWATTKHQKGAKDKARAKLFAKLIRQVEVAAREGGGDVAANANLRTMYQKARDSSVPLDTIERAIKRGTGELEGVRYEAMSYEGYAASGVAVIVECLTDNRNRTGAEIRTIFSRNGGSMAEPGAVSWQFARKGVISVSRGILEDDLMAIVLETGAEDLRDDGESWSLIAEPSELQGMREALEGSGITPLSVEIQMIATADHVVEDEPTARKILRLLELLDDQDDVQNVWSNFDIPDAVLAAASA
ncbi:MAG TPA: YebC/PmpR family DNA-binding transcriptional regulator [Acidimicrobiales bacterium]|nr:YebC/PmpR family DNA-binding transcriptional regulator [Acidimicrobiales bacterium]